MISDCVDVTQLAPSILGHVPYTYVCMRIYRPIGSHPRLIGPSGTPVRGPISNKSVGHHVLLVIQHLYKCVHLQILVFLHSVKNSATRMGCLYSVLPVLDMHICCFEASTHTHIDLLEAL